MVEWGKMPWSVSFDEARAMGIPEQVIQDALKATDSQIYGFSVEKLDPETGVWMRVNPLRVEGGRT